MCVLYCRPAGMCSEVIVIMLFPMFSGLTSHFYLIHQTALGNIYCIFDTGGLILLFIREGMFCKIDLEKKKKKRFSRPI